MTLDISAWKTYKFGDIARNLTTASQDPLFEGIERYVGLEHIIPGNVHIKSWGNVADGTTFTRIFRKGQVLFGKRRAYQRKAAIAEFNGICSGDILVFEANEKYVVSKLLPFIVQSDKFFDYAIKTSAGSLSPRTKFKDLAKYSFKLPPLDEQKRLAELLWSVDESIEKEINCYQTLKTLKVSKTKDLFSKYIKEKIILGNLCIEKPSYGATASAVEHKPGMPRYIRITDISKEGDLLENDIKSIGSKKYDKYRLEEGDLLIARTAAVGRAFVYKKHYGDCVYAGYLIKFRINKNKVLPEYVFCYLHSPIFKNWVRKTTHIGIQANINAKEYSEHLIPIPSICIQKKIVESIKELKGMEESLSCQINRLKVIKKQIINQIFGGKS